MSGLQWSQSGHWGLLPMEGSSESGEPRLPVPRVPCFACRVTFRICQKEAKGRVPCCSESLWDVLWIFELSH